MSVPRERPGPATQPRMVSGDFRKLSTNVRNVYECSIGLTGWAAEGGRVGSLKCRD